MAADFACVILYLASAKFKCFNGLEQTSHRRDRLKSGLAPAYTKPDREANSRFLPGGTHTHTPARTQREATSSQWLPCEQLQNDHLRAQCELIIQLGQPETRPARSRAPLHMATGWALCCLLRLCFNQQMNTVRRRSCAELAHTMSPPSSPLKWAQQWRAKGIPVCRRLPFRGSLCLPVRPAQECAPSVADDAVGEGQARSVCQNSWLLFGRPACPVSLIPGRLSSGANLPFPARIEPKLISAQQEYSINRRGSSTCFYCKKRTRRAGAYKNGRVHFEPVGPFSFDAHLSARDPAN